MKKAFVLLALLICSTLASGQNLKWSAQSRKVEKGVYEVIVSADIPYGFHLYDMGPYEDGPMAMSIVVKPGDGAALVGTLKVPAAKKYFDEMYGMEIGVYEGRAEFIQRVSGKKNSTVTVIAGGMVCSGYNCQPPRKQSMTVVLK